MYTKEALHHAEVHVSEALESYGIPDPYYFDINKKGKLVSPNNQIPIEDVIVKDNYLGAVEYEAFKKIQDRINLEKSGFFLWISPPYKDFYPTSKIVISEVVFIENEKRLLNRAIVTNWDNLGSILTARELALLSELDPNSFKTLADVRANPIFIDKENEEKLSLAIKKMLDKNSIEMMTTGTDFRAKEKYMNDLLAGKQISRGQNPLSCPTIMTGSTAFKIFSGEDEYGSLQFECPHCHKTNTRPAHQLVSNCQHCGCDVRCGS